MHQREPLNTTVTLVEYDSRWPEQFQAESTRICAALGEKALMVEHVGSTSVPGLAAKPVIDIVLAVGDSADEGSYLPALESAGYQLRIREPEWFEHRLLKNATAAVNLHVFTAGCPEIGRMLLFRDWLRANEADRALYEATKRRLASREWKYMQDYADAKGEVVNQIMERAKASAR